MTSIVLPNASNMDSGPLQVPLKNKTEPYKFEMLFNGLADRGYADDPVELLEMLIPGYSKGSVGEKMAMRLHHAVRVQTVQQANINYFYNVSDVCDPEEQVVLFGSRSVPVDVPTWNSEVPLILVDVFYEPHGRIKPPVSGIADVQDPPNMLWLRTADEYEYLVSLHRCDYIVLSEHMDYR